MRSSTISFISALKQVGGASAAGEALLASQYLAQRGVRASLSGGDVAQKLQKLHLQCCTAMGDAMERARWPTHCGARSGRS